MFHKRACSTNKHNAVVEETASEETFTISLDRETGPCEQAQWPIINEVGDESNRPEAQFLRNEVC